GGPPGGAGASLVPFLIAGDGDDAGQAAQIDPDRRGGAGADQRLAVLAGRAVGQVDREQLIVAGRHLAGLLVGGLVLGGRLRRGRLGEDHAARHVLLVDERRAV